MSEKTVWQALAEAMAAMDNPVKAKAVQAGSRRYNYEVLADVLDIVKPALHANGLCLKQGVSMEDGKTVMRTGVAYGENVYILDTLPVTIPSDPQAAGSAITYARRYGLKTAFGLAGVDDDGEAAHRMASTASVKPYKAPSSPMVGSYEAEAREAGERAMKRWLTMARNAGMDMKGLGEQVRAHMGKESTEYTSEDYTRVNEYLSNIVKEAAK